MDPFGNIAFTTTGRIHENWGRTPISNPPAYFPLNPVLWPLVTRRARRAHNDHGPCTLKCRLVEVVPGEATPPATVRRAWGLQEQMGKTPIASLDRPGFVVNRYFVPWANDSAVFSMSLR